MHVPRRNSHGAVIRKSAKHATKAACEFALPGALREAARQRAGAGECLLGQCRMHPITLRTLLRIAPPRDPRGLEGDEPGRVCEQRKERAHGVSIVKTAAPKQREHVLP
jgi:hypothetical protein